jgi:hypothetical protein
MTDRPKRPRDANQLHGRLLSAVAVRGVILAQPELLGSVGKCRIRSCPELGGPATLVPG